MIYSIERDSPRGAYHLFELQRESTFTVPFRHWQDIALFGAYERPKLFADVRPRESAHGALVDA
ncbi:hypothetical protein PAMC26577_30920 [Caballeronia sordidicola]|uniref:Uncharacterized protein n=1 Tax=Caballeronia sordidicola TaxID=196367 RepID=A0A242MDU4_CABSO|nr:hypothetical protein PAMC26577_30920 [Caballeronia sordidicola]